ncbi:GIY-YIG nuclease family protein, partial [Sphingobacterium faecale]
SLKDPQLITRLLKIYTKVVCFAAESLVYFGAEWWCNIVRNMHLFTKLDTPIPNWLSQVWEIESLIGLNSSKKSEETTVILILNKKEFRGSILYTKHYGKETNYKLFFSKDFAEELKDCFVMSYMRTLENKLRRGNLSYNKDIEEEIPFWEFIDLEFDKTNRTLHCKAHYTQKPIFPELFKQFTKSHILKDMENRLLNKGEFKFIKQDWKPKSEIRKQLSDHPNFIYYLIDTKNKLLYIGESETLKRIRQHRPEIPNWDYFRLDFLPLWISRSQRLELERLMIRSFAALLSNHKKIKHISISEYSLANKKIDD